MRLLRNILTILPLIGIVLGLVATNHGWPIAHAVAIGTLAAAALLLLAIRLQPGAVFFRAPGSQMGFGVVIALGAATSGIAGLLDDVTLRAVVIWAGLFFLSGFLYYQLRKAKRARTTAP